MVAVSLTWVQCVLSVEVVRINETHLQQVVARCRRDRLALAWTSH